MSQDIDLKKIERKAWMSYFQDGLWEIFLGAFHSWMGSHDADRYGLDGRCLVHRLLLNHIGLEETEITYPRLGYVKFGKKQTELTTRFMLLGVILMLLGILVV